jgi:hypothetical protein
LVAAGNAFLFDDYCIGDMQRRRYFVTGLAPIGASHSRNTLVANQYYLSTLCIVFYYSSVHNLTHSSAPALSPAPAPAPAPSPSPSQALYPHVNSTSQWLQTNMSSKQKSKLEKFHKKREEGFDLGSVPHAKLKSYSALHDPNMRHYFENPNVQRLLYNSGQIDSHGRVINLQKNKTKLQILEREFKEAEIAEMKKLREEEEMRVSSVVV